MTRQQHFAAYMAARHEREKDDDERSTATSNSSATLRVSEAPATVRKHKSVWTFSATLMLRLCVILIIYIIYSVLQREYYLRCRSTYTLAYLFRASKMCTWLEGCTNAIEVMLGICITAVGNAIYRMIKNLIT